MELSLEAQTRAFIYSCVLGACLAAVYTAMGIIKLISPPGKRLLFMMDLCFMLLCTGATFFYSLAVTWGSLRYYVVLGELLGFFLFYLFFGELILKCSKALIAFISKIYYLIAKPFRTLFHRLYLTVSELLSGAWRKIKSKLTVKKKKREMKRKIKRKVKRTESESGLSAHETPKKPIITAKLKERY